MGSYLAYAEYKDSGIEWLGKIPTHWEAKRLKFTSTVQPSNVDKKTDEDEESVLLCNYSDVYNNAEITSKLEFMRATATQSEIEKFLIAKDQVIVTKDSETREDIAVPAYVAEDFENVLCGYHLTQIKPKEVFGKYLFRLFQSRQFNAQFILGANGVTRFGLPQYVISNALIAVPPIEEQRSIARFLDYKTAQIDALITKKETLLKKLAEKRTALISQAVTKGCDRTVTLKDSGIEWLGKIPSHWSLLPLKYAVTFQRGHDLPAESRIEGDVPLVSSSGVSGCHNVAVATAPGIVTGRYGTIGKFTYIEEDYWPLNTTLYSIRTYANDVQFLWYMMHNLSGLFLLNSQKSAVPGVDRNDLHPVLTAIPSIQEQGQIVKFLDKWTVEIDKQITQIEEAIANLKEYRTALITNAVTGKIDVRDVMLEPEPVEAA